MPFQWFTIPIPFDRKSCKKSVAENFLLQLTILRDKKNKKEHKIAKGLTSCLKNSHNHIIDKWTYVGIGTQEPTEFFSKEEYEENVI